MGWMSFRLPINTKHQPQPTAWSRIISSSSGLLIMGHTAAPFTSLLDANIKHNTTT